MSARIIHAKHALWEWGMTLHSLLWMAFHSCWASVTEIHHQGSIFLSANANHSSRLVPFPCPNYQKEMSGIIEYSIRGDFFLAQGKCICIVLLRWSKLANKATWVAYPILHWPKDKPGHSMSLDAFACLYHTSEWWSLSLSLSLPKCWKQWSLLSRWCLSIQSWGPGSWPIINPENCLGRHIYHTYSDLLQNSNWNRNRPCKLILPLVMSLCHHRRWKCASNHSEQL